MKSDEFNLARFMEAQETSYAAAIAELRSGRKKTHWIWFVFPQLKGLGSSFNSEHYGLSGLAEARAYLAHPDLGPRLREATAAMLAHQSKGASAVLGELDALKFRSCLTLFSLADPADHVFGDALDSLFGGERDTRTLRLLEAQGEV
ncbi:DUF1810 domain-containing protein [Pseudomonas sp. B392_1p]|uniref:DUF1810 domain-containing protein n=1 Tax=Pseudomonas sp. B392_1p TaxID=3457507 RepID=UPI003FD0C35D